MLAPCHAASAGMKRCISPYKRNVVDQFAAVGLEGRAKVVNVHAGKLRHQPVRATRRNAPHHEIVDALFSPAADNVVALFQLFEEIWNLARVMLQIAIHREDEVSLRVVEAGGEGRGLSEIAAQLDDEDAAVYGSDLFQQFVTAIGRSVVDEHQLEAVSHWFHDGLEAVVHGGNVFFFVVEGDDNRILRHLFIIDFWRKQGFP